MRVLNFVKDGQIHLGLMTGGGVVDITLAAAKEWPSELGLPESMEQLIDQGENGLAKIREFEKQWGLHRRLPKDVPPGLMAMSEDALKHAPVVACPEKIICIGYNYAAHIDETGSKAPSFPEVFSVSNNALAAHGQSVKLPPTAKLYDYEAELVIVIGKECSGVAKEDALDYVFGYTCGNDLSARDMQRRTTQFYLGKSMDGFAPVGPCIATADSIDPKNLAVSMKRGDEVVQISNTRHLIFDCAYLVSYLSQYVTLRQGDLIFTGTPEGTVIGKPKDEQKWLVPGEKLTASIEGIGELVNTTM